MRFEREDLARAPPSIAKAPLLTLQQDAVGQLCSVSLSVLFGVIRELWEQSPFEKIVISIEDGKDTVLPALVSCWYSWKEDMQTKHSPPHSIPRAHAQPWSSHGHARAKAEQLTEAQSFAVLLRLCQEGNCCGHKDRLPLPGRIQHW